jgi:hypothetical protein
MGIIVAQNQTSNVSNVRQLSVTCEGNLAGFFNVSNTLDEEELSEIAALLNQYQGSLTWMEGTTAKGRLQYTCKDNELTIGWYQPGANKHEGTLVFSERTKLVAGGLRARLQK